VRIKHPVKSMEPIHGVLSFDRSSNRVNVAVLGGYAQPPAFIILWRVTHAAISFLWAGEITRDVSCGNAFSLRWTGSNVVENFPGGSSATFCLDEQVSQRPPRRVSLCTATEALWQGNAHGKFTSTFPGGSVAGTETYQRGELLTSK
jgi:hypothetical protein